MSKIVSILILGVLAFFFLPGEQARFAGMCLASLLVLWFLPKLARQSLGLLMVYVHEVCHGVGGLVTGGKFVEFTVTKRGGVCLTQSNHGLIVSSAGYIGTVAFGSMLLLISAMYRIEPAVFWVLAALFGLSIIKARGLLTILAGAVTTAGLCLLGLLDVSGLVPRMVLNFLGVMFIWYGFLSIIAVLSDALKRKGAGTDAHSMEKRTGVGAPVWAFMFMAVAAFTVVGAFFLILNTL